MQSWGNRLCVPWRLSTNEKLSIFSETTRFRVAGGQFLLKRKSAIDVEKTPGAWAALARVGIASCQNERSSSASSA